MAPAREPVYAKDEKVLCFHHELLYEAKVTDSRPVDENDRKSPPQYRVHYKGWKSTWDDWVPADRLRKHTEENLQMAKNLKNQMEDLRRANDPKAAKRKTKGDSEFSSNRGSEDRQIANNASGRGQKRGRDYELDKEDSFLTRPAVRIPLSDHLKSILVDDWEYVTKNLSLVPVPSPNPVNKILDIYFEEEKGKRRLGSAEAEILEEVVQGLKEYFDTCLGRVLLYRFERQQYYEVRKALDGNTKGPLGEEWDGLQGKGVGDVYGAEHLLRLFVSLPELIAQTNMDAQSIKKLKEEIIALSQWLTKNSSRFFTQPYQSASAEYLEQSRGLNTEGQRIDSDRAKLKEYHLR